MRQHLLLLCVTLSAACGLPTADERLISSHAALGSPVVIAQQSASPLYSAIVSSPPTWLGSCLGTDFVAAGRPSTATELNRLSPDGSIELIRDSQPGPRFSLTGGESMVCTDAGALYIAGTAAFGLGAGYLWRSDGTAAGTKAMKPASGAVKKLPGGGLIVRDGLSLKTLDPLSGNTGNAIDHITSYELFGDSLYLVSSSGSVLRSTETLDASVVSAMPCTASNCSTQLFATRSRLFATSSDSRGSGGAHVLALALDGGFDEVLPVFAYPVAADEHLVFASSNNGGWSLFSIDEALDAGARVDLNEQPTSLYTAGHRVWVLTRSAIETVDLAALNPQREMVIAPDGGELSGLSTPSRLGSGLIGVLKGSLIFVSGAGSVELVSATAGSISAPSVVEGVGYFTVSRSTELVLYRTDGTPGGTRAIGAMPRPSSSAADYNLLGARTVIQLTPQGSLLAHIEGGSLRDAGPAPGVLDGLPRSTVPLRIDGGVAFSSTALDPDVWTTDGTATGTKKVLSQAQLVRQGARALAWSSRAIDEVSLGGTKRTFTLDGGSTFALVAGTEREVFIGVSEPPVAGRSMYSLYSQTPGGQAVLEATLASPPQGAARVGQTLVYSDGLQLSHVDASHDAGVVKRVPAGRLFETTHGALAVVSGENAGLWSSDGFDAGLVWSGTASRFVVSPTQLFFAGSLDGGLPTMWRTDGTAAGTIQLSTAILPLDAPLNLLFEHVSWVQHDPTDLLFFAAGDELGNEPWVTDGTVEGTHRVADLMPGAESSNPRFFTQENDDLFFVATNPQGTALYQLAISGAPTGGGSGGAGGSGGGAGSSGSGGGSTLPDGGPTATGGGAQSPDSGCGCITSSVAPWWLLAAFFLLRARGR